VAEVEPVLVRQHEEALDGSVVWIKEKLREGTQLCCTVPPVRAVNENILLILQDRVKDLID